MSFEVIYLTGPPAAGKSTLSRALQASMSLSVFEYGTELTKHLNARSTNLTQSTLRARSSSIVTIDDVKAVDKRLIQFVDDERIHAHVLIDSHAVTKERYGFRITPFRLDDFTKLAPTQIWLLYVSPEETVRRIAASSDGRPTITSWEASFHLEMQASVAIAYGMHVGISIHVINAEQPVDALVADLEKRFVR